MLKTDYKTYIVYIYILKTLKQVCDLLYKLLVFFGYFDRGDQEL